MTKPVTPRSQASQTPSRWSTSSGGRPGVVSDIIPTRAVHIASSGAIRLPTRPSDSFSRSVPSIRATDRHSPVSPRMKYVIDEQSGCEHGRAMKSSGPTRVAGLLPEPARVPVVVARRIGSIGFARPEPNTGWKATPAM